MLAQSTSAFTEGASKTKRSKFATTKAIKASPAIREHRRWEQVRPETIDPPAGNRWNSKHKRNEEDAFAIRYSKNSGQQHQRKQNRDDDISAFDFFDKGEKEEEQRKSNEQFNC